MLSFNLVREPWIRCVNPAGDVRLVGLAEVLAASHQFSGITDESPLVIAALHRLLLAILHRNFGPRDTETWGRLWRLGSFPPDVLQAYWVQWESHFDLFDADRPFYQSAGITELDEPGALWKFEFHRASGADNPTLIEHTTADRPPALTPAEAARALVTRQAFALGGTISYLKSCERPSDRYSKDAPFARGAVCLVRGGNLFQTLLLNLAEYDPVARPTDLPCWERELSQGRGERIPDGRVDLFTWQSRRGRLFSERGADGSTLVKCVKLVPGFSQPVEWDPSRDESMRAFRLRRNAKPDESPLAPYQISPEQAVWRNSEAILHGVEGEARRTVTSEWIGQLAADRELPDAFPLHLEVLGFAAKSGQDKVIMWRREQLPLTPGLLRDDRCREALHSALSHADDTASSLTSAANRLAAEILLLAQNPNSKQKSKAKELSQGFGVEIQYWSSLEVAFREFLASLGASAQVAEADRDSAQDAAFDAWKQHVRTAALDAFALGVSGIAQNVRGLRAHAIAEAELRRRLAAVARKLLAGADAANGKK